MEHLSAARPFGQRRKKLVAQPCGRPNQRAGRPEESLELEDAWDVKSPLTGLLPRKDQHW